MSADAVDVTFADAFKSLIVSLSKSLQTEKLVSLNPRVIEPFHRLSNPSDSRLLKPLVKLFDGKCKDNGFRLAPRTFYALFAIVLQFPYSRAQEKLLHGFLSVIQSYKDSPVAAAELSRLAGKAIDEVAFKEGRHFICEKLVHYASAVLQNAGTDSRVKQMAVQTVNKLLTTDPNTVGAFLDDKIGQYMLETVCDGTDYVLRLLTAESIREMIHQEAFHFETLFSNCTYRFREDSFSTSMATSSWIGGVVEVLYEIDIKRGLDKKHDRVFRLRSFEFDDGAYNDEAGNILAILSNSCTFVLPAGKNKTLSLIDIPFMSNMMTSLEPDPTSDAKAVPDTLKITFSNSNGDRYFQGTKRAIYNFCVTLANEEDTERFVQYIHESSIEAASNERTETSVTESSPQLADGKQSLVFAAMDWNSEDDAWVREGQALSGRGKNGEGAGTYLEDIVQGSPITVGFETEVGQAVTQAVFHSSSTNCQGTKLYKKMSVFRQVNANEIQREKQTPKILETEDQLTALHTDTVSPTLRLSQAANPVFNKENVIEGEGGNDGGPPRSGAEGKYDPTVLHKSTEVYRSSKVAQSKISVVATTTPADGNLDVSKSMVIDGGARKISPSASYQINNHPSEPAEQHPTPLGNKASMARLVVPQLANDKSINLSPTRNSQTIAKPFKTTKKPVTDWNQDLRVDGEDENNVRPKRKGKKTTNTQPNATSRKSNTKPKTKQPIGDRGKKLLTQPENRTNITSTETPTVDSTRSRRGATTKSAKYVEQSSGEDVDDCDVQAVTEVTRDKVKDNIRAETVSRKSYPMTPAQRKNAKQPISISSASLATSENEEANADPSIQPVHSAFTVGKCLPNITEKLASPPTRIIQPRAGAPTDSHSRDDNVAAQDSHPLKNVIKSAGIGIDASFGAKLSQMLTVDATKNEPSLSLPRIPFGNSRKFIANINAAKCLTSQKSMKKSPAKPPWSPEPRVPRLQGTKGEEGQQEGQAQERRKQDRNEGFLVESDGSAATESLDSVNDPGRTAGVEPSTSHQEAMVTLNTIETHKNNHTRSKGSTSEPETLHSEAQAAEKNIRELNHAPLQTSTKAASWTPTEGLHDQLQACLGHDVSVAADAKPFKSPSRMLGKVSVPAGAKVLQSMSSANVTTNTSTTDQPDLMADKSCQLHQVAADFLETNIAHSQAPLFSDEALPNHPQAQHPKPAKMSKTESSRTQSLQAPDQTLSPQPKEPTIDQGKGKPYIVHFAINGPANQGKSPVKAPARKSLPTCQDTEGRQGYALKKVHYSEPAVNRAETILDTRIEFHDTAARFVAEDGDIGAPSEEDGFTVTEPDSQVKEPESHLPQEAFSLATALNPLCACFTKSAMNVVQSTSSEHSQDVDVVSEQNSCGQVVTEGTTSSKSAMHQHSEYRESETGEMESPPARQSSSKQPASSRPASPLVESLGKAYMRRNIPLKSDLARKSNLVGSERESTSPSTTLCDVSTEVQVSQLKRCSKSALNNIVEVDTMVGRRGGNADIASTIIQGPVTAKRPPSICCDHVAATSEKMVLAEHKTNTVCDSSKMPPPPRPEVLRVSLTAANSRLYSQSVDMTPSGSAKKLMEYPPFAESGAPSAKRSKSQMSRMLTNLIRSPTGTPVSFSANIGKDMKELEKHAKHSGAEDDEPTKGNESTLLKQTRNIGRSSFLKQTRLETPGLMEENDSSEPELEGTPAPQYRHTDQADKHLVMDSRDILRKTLDDLTEVILYRLSKEEKATRSQTALYNHQGAAVLEQIKEAWINSVKHEKLLLLKDLKGEKAILDKIHVSLSMKDQQLKDKEPASDMADLIPKRMANSLLLLRRIRV